jgi:5-methylcytosine-specific restriction endonuclease McrA
MADINSAIVYSSATQKFLTDKLSDNSFTYRNWSDDDLLDFRVTVRDYYRAVQSGRCAFCKAPISLTSAANCHVEHLVPKSKRREFVFEPKNLCVICADCNAIKRAKEVEAIEPEALTRGRKVRLYPRSSGAFLIVHPHFDVWDEHIVGFGQFFVDLTDKGNFTIGACVLNRKLRKFGWEAVITDDATLREAATGWLDAKDSIASTRWLQIMKRLLILT